MALHHDIMTISLVALALVAATNLYLVYVGQQPQLLGSFAGIPAGILIGRALCWGQLVGTR